jgi:DNA-binding protein YbaB
MMEEMVYMLASVNAALDSVVSQNEQNGLTFYGKSANGKVSVDLDRSLELHDIHINDNWLARVSGEHLGLTITDAFQVAYRVADAASQQHASGFERVMALQDLSADPLRLARRLYLCD